jgi:polar amino acid transport system substrate-binding protein
MPIVNPKRRQLVLSSTLLGAGLPALAAPRRTLVLAGAAELLDSFHGAWTRLIYQEALRRLGSALELRAYPAQRASMMSDGGLVDGEINRAARYGQRHPGMLRVDPAHFSITFAAYGRPAVHLQPGWEGLRNRGYRVEYRSGVAICELELPAVVPDGALSSSSRSELALRKLVEDRADVFVDVASVVDPLLRKREFAASGIGQVAVMETVDMHAFLHPRHARLAASLSAVLAQLKREGYIDRCRGQALRLASSGGGSVG